ncbi:MAG: ParB N-terminal domain-containing protein, partial [Alphaproteobacteria bacterium]|nr:ParB N-terminal domain-containing protein [Alphaproteobacteria bacterium]
MSINPFITSHIDDIYLDSDNPRHDSISEQQDIIKHLVTTEEIKIENLAKDIIKLGMISPIEVIATIKVEGEENKYIVVEGNRRICSLKLLNDIDKSPLSHKQNF